MIITVMHGLCHSDLRTMAAELAQRRANAGRNVVRFFQVKQSSSTEKPWTLATAELGEAQKVCTVEEIIHCLAFRVQDVDDYFVDLPSVNKDLEQLVAQSQALIMGTNPECVRPTSVRMAAASERLQSAYPSLRIFVVSVCRDLSNAATVGASESSYTPGAHWRTGPLKRNLDWLFRRIFLDRPLFADREAESFAGTYGRPRETGT